jgi:hypothetical protein
MQKGQTLSNGFALTEKTISHEIYATDICIFIADIQSIDNQQITSGNERSVIAVRVGLMVRGICLVPTLCDRHLTLKA